MYLQPQHKRRAVQEGMTFIEIIIALAIMGLLAVVGIPAALNLIESGRVRSADATIQTMKTSMLQFNIDVGSYPRKLSELETRPSDERGKKWRGPYMEKFNEDDPWGNPWVYRLTPGQKNPYELYSTGSKGSDATKEERIGTWN